MDSLRVILAIMIAVALRLVLEFPLGFLGRQLQCAPQSNEDGQVESLGDLSNFVCVVLEGLGVVVV
jgi:hypothetical protein